MAKPSLLRHPIRAEQVVQVAIAPEFDIDPNSLNNGIISKLGGGTDLTNTRSPSLRDLLNPLGQLNGPMMHDGSLTSLAAMINHYVAPPTNASLDPRLNRPPLNLNQTRRDELIAFLRTLTGSAVYTAPKWSSPFNASGQLTLIVLPASAAQLQPNLGATSAVFTATAVPGLSYRVESSTNLAQWTFVTTVTANTTGLLEHPVTMGTAPTFFRFTYIPLPASSLGSGVKAAVPGITQPWHNVTAIIKTIINRCGDHCDIRMLGLHSLQPLRTTHDRNKG